MPDVSVRKREMVGQPNQKFTEKAATWKQKRRKRPKPGNGNADGNADGNAHFSGLTCCHVALLPLLLNIYRKKVVIEEGVIGIYRGADGNRKRRAAAPEWNRPSFQACRSGASDCF